MSNNIDYYNELENYYKQFLEKNDENVFNVFSKNRCYSFAKHFDKTLFNSKNQNVIYSDKDIAWIAKKVAESYYNNKSYKCLINIIDDIIFFGRNVASLIEIAEETFVRNYLELDNTSFSKSYLRDIFSTFIQINAINKSDYSSGLLRRTYQRGLLANIDIISESDERKKDYFYFKINTELCEKNSTKTNEIKKELQTYTLNTNSSDLIKDIELLLFKLYIKSEKEARRLSTSAFEPSFDSVLYFRKTFHNTVQKIFGPLLNFYSIDNLTEIISKYENQDYLELYKTYKDGKEFYCVKPNPICLTTILLRYAILIQLIIEIESRCYRMRRLPKDSFIIELDYFLKIAKSIELDKNEKILTSTLEKYSQDIKEISKIIHDCCGLGFSEFDFINELYCNKNNIDYEKYKKLVHDLYYKVIY